MSNLSQSEEAQLLSTIEMFEVITQSQPLDPQSWEILKEAYFKLGKQAEVLATSKKLAQVYVQLGQLSSAILEYETILQRHPDDREVIKALQDIEKRASSFGSSGGHDSDIFDKPATAAPAAIPMPTASLPPTSAPKPSLPLGGGIPAPSLPLPTPQTPGRVALPADFDDGRAMMQKIFVEGKLIAQPDFNQLWIAPNLQGVPENPSEPFLHLASERNLIPLERGVRILSERARLPFIPIGKYDIDIDTARLFPKEVCRRWCVLPFDKMSKSILVATSNPFNKQAVKELEAAGKGRLIWYLASPTELFTIIKKVLR